MKACCSGLGNGYFVILKEYSLRNNNQQSVIPRKKSGKISNRDLSISMVLLNPKLFLLFNFTSC